MAILEVEHIKKKFGKTDVLKDISFSLEQGEVLSIIGSSGSGKTTLLRCLNFLEKADGGTMTFDDETIDLHKVPKRTIARIRKKTAFVFQNYNLFANKTALQNVTEGLIVGRKMPKDEANKIAHEALKKVGMEDRSDYYPSQLSGGQQQRTSIGRALVKNPDILLCDEPTGALDYKTSKEILKLIEDVNKKYGNTIIMVTHNDAIKNMADRVIKLRDGAVRHNDVNEHKVSAEDLDW